MKIIKFREILHTIANKGGFDPEQGNFLTNQAIPIGRYIDQWVRRVYDGRDWPELVVTRQFEPTAAHIVPYQGVDDVYGSDQPFRLGRVLNVYLVDPRTTAAPVGTDFNMLMSGVHVGHEHGTSVWIRYLFPPPRYTCEVWDANHTYVKDEVTYSPTSGECYRSRIYGNRNHDPGRSFQLPPLPPDEDPPDVESDTPPEVVVFQEYIPHDPGVVGQTKIMRVRVDRAVHVIVPDPATASDYFQIRVADVDDVELGNVTVSGPDTLTDIVAQLVSDLASATGFTVTVISANPKSFTIEHLSEFGVTDAVYRYDTGFGPAQQYQLDVAQLQTYIEPRPYVEGQAQATYIRLSTESTIPGALYRITMTDGNGDPHVIEYQSVAADGMAQIIQGWAAAIDASTDEFWEGVIRQANPGQGILFLAIYDNASTNAVILLVGDPYWEWNPFPQVLAEPVIEGALSDLYAEWGQTDKAQATKGGVPAEVDVNAAEFTTTPNPPLSGQQSPLSRYKV